MWHKELPPSERHAIHAFEYADEAERLGATGLTSSDQGKVAWQKDNDEFFTLVATSPEPVWEPFTNHQHANKSTLDKITEDEGLPLWNGGAWPGGGGGGTAQSTTYDDTETGLSTDNVQGAIEKLTEMIRDEISVGMEATGGDTTVDVQIGNTLYRVHTYTTVGAGSFVVTSAGEIEYLLVGGGGAGGSSPDVCTGAVGGAGGGGGGSVRTGKTYLEAGTFQVVVGAGGVRSYPAGVGGNGESSSLAGLPQALGGGGGGSSATGENVNGSSLGTGGGGGETGIGAPGILGGAGGNGSDSANLAGGGGGGASNDGGWAWASSDVGGAGGDGFLWEGTGSPEYYGGGGGGAVNRSVNPGVGGAGGGGKGATWDPDIPAEDGQPGKGGGGGGGTDCSEAVQQGGNGGSGVVIIRYPILGS